MTLEMIHFTDLKDQATRGQLERGARYVMCHDFRERDSYNPLSDRPLRQDASCYETLIASHVEMLPRSMGMPPMPFHDEELWTERHPQFSTLSKYGRIMWNYAADNGLWDVDGISYINDSNYLLNINELIRKGIKIDQTAIPDQKYQNGST